MRQLNNSPYQPTQNLSRGLLVLRAMNEAPGGNATPRDVSEWTGLNRSTVKRLLETLVGERYLRPCGEDGSYALAPALIELSRGLTEEPQLVEYAGTVLSGLGESTGWSLRLTTPWNDRMMVRKSTHPRSRLSDTFSVGVRNSLPIMLTAAGRAFFASGDATHQRRLLAYIGDNPGEQTVLARDHRLVELLKQRVQDDGYGTNDGDWGERQIGAIAVPVRNADGRPLAAVSMIFPRSAGKTTIEQEFLPALKASAAQIETRLNASAS